MAPILREKPREKGWTCFSEILILHTRKYSETGIVGSRQLSSGEHPMVAFLTKALG